MFGKIITKSVNNSTDVKSVFKINTLYIHSSVHCLTPRTRVFFRTNNSSSRRFIPRASFKPKFEDNIQHKMPGDSTFKCNNSIPAHPSYIVKISIIFIFHLRIEHPSGLFSSGYPTKPCRISALPL